MAESESLKGSIEDIVFYNPENGYTVCRFLAEGGVKVNLVGSFPPLSPGETLEVRGSWETNPKFGRQFKAERFAMVLPASAKGVEKFLASGLIRGIGPVLAKRIVDRFGAETAAVLGDRPERLREVGGIGEVKLKEILSSWAEHREIRDLIMFLQEHGVSTTLAAKIHKQYGGRAFHVLRSNPYQLCLDIWGVGFKTADAIALKLGMDPAAVERLSAFILYLLEKDNEQGHVFSAAADVAASCAEEVDATAERFEEAVKRLVAAGALVVEGIPGGRALYRPFFHQAENEVARGLRRLASFAAKAPESGLDAAIAGAAKELGIVFSPAQETAVRESVTRKILVITGGPGTGKTTIIKAVTDVFERWGRRVLLAAPTGRAAKRLAEATGREARTLHRVLEYQPKEGGFSRGEKRPLKGDALIIDEFSMVDLPLMFHLLKAVPDWMRLILVGDRDQLPSVGPGSLLRDIIDSGAVDVVRLDRIFRQERESLIVANAHRVNRGEPLLYPEKGDREADFYFLRKEDESEAFATVMKLALAGVPRRLGLSPLSTKIQVISPMYRGLVGVENLNRELQARLNPNGEAVRLGPREFRVRDKVMQVRNDYDKDVFNGDVGSVVQVDKARFRLTVEFDGRPVPYDREDLNDLALAYAITVHKAQGSEYQAVILPVMTQHFIMLQRNLFYTALTRARKLSIVVGSAKALHIAIKNDKPVNRNGRLREKLSSGVRTGQGSLPV